MSATIFDLIYNDVPFVFTTICFIDSSFIFMLVYLFTYAGVHHDFRIKCCPCMFRSNTTSVTGGAGTSNPSRSHPFTRSFYLLLLSLCYIKENKNMEQELPSIPEHRVF